MPRTAPATDIPLPSDERVASDVQAGIDRDLGRDDPANDDGEAKRAIAAAQGDIGAADDVRSGEDAQDVYGRDTDDDVIYREGSAQDHDQPQKGGSPERTTPPAHADLDPHLRMTARGLGLDDGELQARLRARGADAVRAELEQAEAQILTEQQFLTGGTPNGAHAGFLGPDVPLGATLDQPQAPPASGQPTPPAPGTPGSDGQSLADLTDQEIDAARDEYGDQYADHLKRMRTDARQQRQSQQQWAQAEQARLAQQVDSWLDEFAREGYEEFLGRSRHTATAEQLANRQSVLLTAGGVARGYQARNRAIDPRVALARGLVAESAQMRQESARRQVEQQVEKRSRGIQLPPSSPGSGRRQPESPERSAMSAIADWHERKGHAIPPD